MTSNPWMFTSLDKDVDEQDKITFGDNSKGRVQGLGKVAISNDLSISNVLLVAPLSFNLLSVGQLCDLGIQCLFTPTEVVVSKMDDESVIFKGFRYNNLYLVDFSSEDANLRTFLFTKVSAFRPRGVPGPTSKLSPRAPAQMGRRETEHEEGKETGKRGNPRPPCCPAPRSGALAVGGYKRPRGRERETVLPRGQPSHTRALDLPFIGVRRGPRCTMGDVAVC
jgi:hypothetical protein